MYYECLEYLKSKGLPADEKGFQLVDRKDGRGVVIDSWDTQTLGPVPTAAELAAFTVQAQAAQAAVVAKAAAVDAVRAKLAAGTPLSSTEQDTALRALLGV